MRKGYLKFGFWNLFGIWILIFGISASCAHPMMEGKKYTVATVSRSFAGDANHAYEAVRWALKTTGYNIIKEDLDNGVITSGWLPSGVDSFYIAPFGEEHKDYGVNGSYYRLEIKLTPDAGGARTTVDVTSQVKSMAIHLKSSEVEERKILKKIADYLRGEDIKLTNIGVEE